MDGRSPAGAPGRASFVRRVDSGIFTVAEAGIPLGALDGGIRRVQLLQVDLLEAADPSDLLRPAALRVVIEEDVDAEPRVRVLGDLPCALEERDLRIVRPLLLDRA